MINIGITGQSGFIGTHLFNFLRLQKEEFVLIPFEDRYFEDEDQLKKFVKKCDAIVHLAAMNRHENPEIIYNTNIKLVQTLIKAMEDTDSHPHILFSSSTQEEKDNLYGKSKNDGRLLFENWARKNTAAFTGFIIPNVFGPFGNPFYNSVVATFCYQLVHNEQPKIVVDANLQLIYVTELAELFYKNIIKVNGGAEIIRYQVPHTSETKVSDILSMLENYKTTYFNGHCFPELSSIFELNLFNTFRSYIDHHSRYPVMLKKNADNRGVFVESIKTSLGGQFSFSTTKPGITRGNHFHTRKIERFIVIQGSAMIELRRIGTNQKMSFELSGENPSFVDMPVWFTHNITNVGDNELITLFWINEFFNPDDPDTYFEEV